jgi:hypothetical protein
VSNEVEKEIARNIVGKPLSVLGDWLSSTLYLLAHGKIEKANDLRKKYETRRKVYEKRVLEDINSIPTDSIREPTMQQIAVTLEAATLCLEENPLWEMFAALVASSFDSRKYIHPSFADTLKNLSPLDAANLLLFDNPDGMLPIVKYIANFTDRVPEVFVYDVFLANKDEQDIKAQSISLGNLKRCQLIDIDYGNYAADEKYVGFLDDNITSQISNDVKSIPTFTQLSYRKGRACPTSYGVSFFLACQRPNSNI